MNRELPVIGRVLALLACTFTAVPAFAATDGSVSSVASPVFQQAGSERWIFTPLLSYSDLSDGRSYWSEANLELLYRANPNLVLGGALDIRHRFGKTDELYSVSAAYLPNRNLELHGGVAIAPDADFSAMQHYNAGLEWWAFHPVSLLFDYERLNFGVGSLDEYKPGFRYWFSDTTYFTARYTDGRAFNQRNFDGYSLQFNLGMHEQRRLVLGFAHGSDPEKDPGVPGVILTHADTYSVYYHHPLNPKLELIAGAEYEDRKNLYSRSTFTLGFSKRF